VFSFSAFPPRGKAIFFAASAFSRRSAVTVFQALETGTAVFSNAWKNSPRTFPRLGKILCRRIGRATQGKGLQLIFPADSGWHGPC